MYSVNKGADRQCCYRTAGLHLCFRTHLKQVFSFSTIPTLLSPIILSFMNLRLRMLLFFFLLVIYLSIYLFIYLFYFIFYF